MDRSLVLHLFNLSDWLSILAVNSHLRISDSKISLNEAVICTVNADSGQNKLSILHHSSGSGWPVLGTQLHPSLLTPTQHHHHTTLPLIQHLHKVLHCSRHRALDNDEALPQFIAMWKKFQYCDCYDIIILYSYSYCLTSTVHVHSY